MKDKFLTLEKINEIYLKYSRLDPQYKVLTSKDLKGADLFRFKFQQYNFAKNSFNKHEYYFSCPQKWIDAGRNGNKGQGDVDEGLYARIKKTSAEKLKNIRDKYPELIEYENNKYIDFKLKRALFYPTLCYYTVLANSNSVKILEPNILHRDKYLCTMEIDIEHQFFKDFTANSIEEYGMLQFIDHESFILDLINGINKQGFHCIEAKKIEYVDRKNKEWIGEGNPENAIFYKGIEYAHQEEFRVVIKDAEASLYEKYNSGNNACLIIKAENQNNNCYLYKLNGKNGLKIKYSFRKIPIDE